MKELVKNQEINSHIIAATKDKAKLRIPKSDFKYPISCIAKAIRSRTATQIPLIFTLKFFIC